VYYQGQWVAIGGTSAATPIWAAGVILVNQALLQNKQKFFYGPSLFYYLANHPANNSPYQDITQGDNLYYQATSGWNYPTGLGTPNLVDFYNAALSAIG
jgi:kumamolisin